MPSRDSSVRSVKLVTAMLLVAVFAAGTVTGAGIHRWLATPSGGPPPPPPMGGPLPLHELDLTPAQWTQADEIMKKHRPELEAVIEETAPRVRAISARIEAELTAILTDAQKAKLERIRAHRPPPPGGPPPGGPPPGGPPPGGPPPGGPPPGGPPPGGPGGLPPGVFPPIVPAAPSDAVSTDSR